MKRLFPVVFLVVASSSWALNFTFLNDSPIAYFTKEDRAIQNAAADKALDTVANGKKLYWSNPKTGNGGYFEPLSTIKKNGRKCRNVKIYNEDNKKRSDQYVFMFCKYRDGWLVPGR